MRHKLCEDLWRHGPGLRLSSHGGLAPQVYYNICGFGAVRVFGIWWRSGRVKAANGEAVVPIPVIGRIDVVGAVEVEVVGVAAVRGNWSR